MAWAAAIAGAADIAGGRQGQIQSAKQAKLSREFSERMSSTAHQRGVADLRAAGLNPILSAMGSQASTPASAMAAQQGLKTDAVSTGLQAAKLSKEKQLLDDQAYAQRAAAGASNSQGAFNTALAAKQNMDNFLRSAELEVYINNPWLMEAEVLLGGRGAPASMAFNSAKFAAKMAKPLWKSAKEFIKPAIGKNLQIPKSKSYNLSSR